MGKFKEIFKGLKTPSGELTPRVHDPRQPAVQTEEMIRFPE